MRKVTRNAFTIVSFGVLGVGYAVGANAQTTGTFSAAGSGTPATSSSATTTSANTPSASASASQSASPSVSQTTSTPAASNSASAKASATPKASSSGSSGATVSKTGAAINYRYGTVQLTVVKTGSTISAINLVQAGATGGREQAFSYLVQEALAAQSASIANLGGATFTTQAFEQALSSALGKF